MDGISQAPKMVAADVPERGRIYYLVDDQYNFIPEAKAFFDWNAATNRAPATLNGILFSFVMVLLLSLAA